MVNHNKLSIKQYFLQKLIDAVSFDNFEQVEKIINDECSIFSTVDIFEDDMDAFYMALYNQNNKMLQFLLDCEKKQYIKKGITDFHLFNLNLLDSNPNLKIDNYIAIICEHDNVQALSILHHKKLLEKLFATTGFNFKKVMLDYVLKYKSAKVLNYLYQKHLIDEQLKESEYFEEISVNMRQDLMIDGSSNKMPQGAHVYTQRVEEFLKTLEKINPSLFKATLLMNLYSIFQYEENIYHSKYGSNFATLKAYFYYAFDPKYIDYEKTIQDLTDLRVELLNQGLKNVLMYVNDTIIKLKESNCFTKSYISLIADKDTQEKVRLMAQEVKTKKEKEHLEHIMSVNLRESKMKI